MDEHLWKEEIMGIFKFELGDVLKDKVTGFQGAVMVRAQYFTGCVHYGLCPMELKDGKPIDWEWIDDSRLVKVEECQRVFQDPKIHTSGPHPSGPSV